MMNESHTTNESSTVDMPKPTAAPLVLAVGIVLAAMGVATSLAFLFVGGVVFVAGLGMWIAQLLPGRGHCREPRVEPSLRPQPVTPAPGEVARTAAGHARLSPAAAGESPSGFRGHQGRPCRRARDAAAGIGLRSIKRSRHLVAREFARRHGAPRRR